MAKEKKQFARSEGGRLLAYDPQGGRYVPVADVSREMRELSKDFPVRSDEKQAFYREKIRLVRSSDVPNEQRKHLLFDIRSSLEKEKMFDKQAKAGGQARGDYEGAMPGRARRTQQRVESYRQEAGVKQLALDVQAAFEEEEEFLVNRRRTHRRVRFDYDGVMPLSRRRALRRARFNDEYLPPSMPVPGGVGSGIFYKDRELLFTNSTTIYHHIITARNVGSPENKWLYLTSTNRAPWCCEAFVSYRERQGPRFTIYDWSKKDDSRWRVSVPIRFLKQYQFTYEAQSVQYSTIYVINDTRRLDGVTWRNRVLLRNRVTKTFDLFHQNDYILPRGYEQSYLWWGPIVETFHPHPHVINEVGFLDIRLLQDGRRRKLTPKVIYFKRKRGFDLAYFKDDFSFIVH